MHARQHTESNENTPLTEIAIEIPHSIIQPTPITNQRYTLFVGKESLSRKMSPNNQLIYTCIMGCALFVAGVVQNNSATKYLGLTFMMGASLIKFIANLKKSHDADQGKEEQMEMRIERRM